MSTQQRKDDHIDICINEPVEGTDRFFDQFFYKHNALPELNFIDIDTGATFLEKKVAAPLIITSMTGGTARAREINERLAMAAEKHGISLGVGSQRIMIEDDRTATTFKVRQIAKSVPIIANIGAVQLNYGVGPEDCQRLVNGIEADGLYLFLNPLQEAIQPEGDRDFSNLLRKIEQVVKSLSVPVLVKEVGAGISRELAVKLKNIGVSIIDVAGQGGTSWAYIEGRRRETQRSLGELFMNWGIPTPIVIHECSQVDGLKVIAGGGIRSGLDAAKAISLGASYASVGLPFLKAAAQSQEDIDACVGKFIHEFKITMFATGSENVNELSNKKLYHLRQCLKTIVNE